MNKSNTKPMVLYAAIFVAGFATRHGIEWLWHNVLMYIVGGVILLVGFGVLCAAMATAEPVEISRDRNDNLVIRNPNE